MARIVWGEGERFAETGVDHGVLYLQGAAVPWNGLVSVDEQYGDMVERALYFDGVRTMVAQKTDDFAVQVEAITYPDEFEDYQDGKQFDLSYRAGTQIHMVYNARAMPADHSYSTMSNSVDLTTFKWDISTTPMPLPGARPSAHLVLDLKEATDEAVQYVEEMLYGSEDTEPFMPSAADFTELVLEHSVLRIFDHGDGTWTAIGPDEMIKVLWDGTEWELTSPSANPLIYHSFDPEPYLADTYVLSDYTP